MTLLESILLGIVQGIAEFLPISSSGHLAIFKHILGSNLGNMNLAFDVLLHFGTLLAIFICFWKDIKKLIVEGFCIIVDVIKNIVIFIHNIGSHEKKNYKKVVDDAYRKFVMMVIVSTIPTGIIGILLESIVETAADTLLIPGICLIITGLLLLIADRSPSGNKRPNQLGYKEAGIVGIAQGFATMPGLSRSGTTITACLLCGFDRVFAVKYSFIMSIPAVLGAAILEGRKISFSALTRSELSNYLFGTAVAFIVGYICIKTMLVIVRNKKFAYFAYYCFVVGALSVIWNFVK